MFHDVPHLDENKKVMRDENGKALMDGVPRYTEVAVVCKCPAGDNMRTTHKRGRSEVSNPVFGDSPLHVPIMTSDYESDITSYMPENYSQELADF